MLVARYLASDLVHASCRDKEALTVADIATLAVLSTICSGPPITATVDVAALQLALPAPLTYSHLCCFNRSAAGTSAGGLVAVSVRCGIPETDMLSALKEACSDLLQHGWKKRIRSVLKPVVERLLPPDAHEQCNASPEVVLTASKISGPCPMCWQSQVFEEPFISREDLVERLLVAVHEPKETDGRLCVPYRKHHYADGGEQQPVAVHRHNVS
eukprot:GHUV01023930.1.p1 GENE.GHUV01023930.1~~GHUV01023930.1.p1  ORF type:complete len:214 (-),score=54.09 GHUV01023930.1:1014-1655(-)